MIQNAIFFFFWKYYFEHTTFLYLSRRSSGHHQSFFFNSKFSSRKSQSQQNLAKKITHFTIQFRSKNLTHLTNLNSLDIENKIQPQRSQKTFWLYKFSYKHVSVWCQKKYFHCTISWRPWAQSWSTLKANVCIFLFISLRKFLFQKRSKVLSGEGRMGEAK